ncbi:maleylpyruvate isomerase N-terminal domain-containing protein [Nocardioides sp. AE5]|uniref:maleylpyruvate isomerase N-terminal domain-containing protein n=1 Tax=Nocardioides sp. AE5 TaxID=2962573 RepID=UPI002881DC8D|nr:maleylpyruvate isomerase N-terminal domain-containing protein [Nocardioides sp. AE5]MDT0203006.1 maleylpyruvate isomerase N-terminal domain-containing protein [Nocardioides sp. AE5]
MTVSAQVYDACLDSLGRLVDGLSPEQLETTVPATPRWTVRSVVAHLAGVSCDNVHGRMDGAPSRTWTARHVAERSAVPVAHLIDELHAHRDQLVQLAEAAEVPAMVWDISVHLADLHESLGLGVPDPACWEPVLDAARERLLPGDLPPLDVAPYELFRGMFSRRSQAQLQAWGNLNGHAAAIGAFGPREDDQPVPGLSAG